MKAIDIKLIRDFKRLWLQALAIALVLACGVAILLTSIGMYTALADTRQAYYERNRFADVFSSVTRAPEALLDEIAQIETVLNAEARITGLAVLDIPEFEESAIGRIISFPESTEPVLNVPILVSGRYPDSASPSEVVVNAPFAAAHGFVPGNSFSANLNGQRRDLTIVGTVLSPEFIYTIGPGAMMPNDETYGIIWMPEAAAAAAFDMVGALNDVALSLTANAAPEPVIAALDRLLEPYGSLGAFDRTTHPSNAFLDAELAQLRGMAAVLPPIFFAISGFLVSIVMSRIIALERSEIGLLKAIGYSDIEICVHFLMLAGLIAVCGTIIGWIAGGSLARAMAHQYAHFFDFPYVIFRVSYWVYAVSGLAAIATTCVGAAQSALKAARLAPAVAMQPPAPPRFKRSWADKAVSRLRLTQSTTMILRSLFRWPIRSFLTALGLGLAVSSVIAAFFMQDALDDIVDVAFYQSNRQDAVFMFTDDARQSAVEDIKAIDGVLQAEGQQFFPVELRHKHLIKRVTIEARTPATDLSRVISKSGKAVTPPPGGIVLSERLAQYLELRAGDRVTAEFLGGQQETFELNVSGLVEQHLGLGAYMDLYYINALFRQTPRISTVNVTLDDNRVADLHQIVKDTPGLTGIIMLTENRRSFEETIEQNVVVMNAVYITIAVLITVGVAYNAARIQLSERARELASLRILGFGKAEVSYILVGEMMLLALLAQPIGWIAGAWIAQAMTNAFSSDLYSIPLVLKPATFATASLIVLAAALASVLLVRRRLDRLNLVAVMKTRE